MEGSWFPEKLVEPRGREPTADLEHSLQAVMGVKNTILTASSVLPDLPSVAATSLPNTLLLDRCNG